MSRVGNAGGLITGTLSYLAPERLRNEPATSQSDIWALGCMAYEMCIAQQLSHNRQVIYDYISGGSLNLSQIDQSFGTPVRDIIEKCLERDPEKRCTALDLRNYIQNFG
jgi:eukaryotic-like serine/threonine-protein kinase